MQFAFFADRSTVILDKHNNKISLSDLTVGQLVQVHAKRQAAGSLLAKRIKIGDFDGDEVELTGVIESLNNDGLVVAGLEFFVDRNTVVRDDQNRPIQFTDLKVGLLVEIRADRQNDNRLFATKIKIEDFPNDEVEVTGVIESLGVNSLVVIEMKFVANNNTVVLDNNNNVIQFANLQIGQFVQIRADRQADGMLLARRMNLEDWPNGEIELAGAIESLDLNSLVVLDKRFVLDQNTVILDNNNNPIKFADLKVGLIIEVRADRNADDTLLATRIKLENLPDDEVEMTGAIVSLGDNSLVVLGLKFIIDASTIIFDKNNNVIKFSDLKVGLIVEIRADRKADGTLLATKIKIEGRMGVQGVVSSRSNGSLNVAGIAVMLDSNTQFRNQNHQSITSQDVHVSEWVEIQIVQNTPTSVSALSVKKIATITGVENNSAPSSSTLENFVLQQNYPNPFNPATTIRFTIPANSGAQQIMTLRIYNVMGQLVRALVNQAFAPGSYITVWSGENDFGGKVSSGFYFYTLQTDNFKAVKVMTLTK